jgi:hypothetical protein
MLAFKGDGMEKFTHAQTFSSELLVLGHSSVLDTTRVLSFRITYSEGHEFVVTAPDVQHA